MMWKLSDETIAEYANIRHDHRRRFEFVDADKITMKLSDDGWIIEDFSPTCTIIRPKVAPGSSEIHEIIVRFDEEA